jgi:hypothetical protein
VIRPGRPARPVSGAILLALAATALLLGGCGKKGPPGAPPGREAEFTYPHAYPAPASAVPPLPDSAEAEKKAEPDRPSLTPGPYERRKTTTYGSQ